MRKDKKKKKETPQKKFKRLVFFTVGWDEVGGVCKIQKRCFRITSVNLLLSAAKTYLYCTN